MGSFEGDGAELYAVSGFAVYVPMGGSQLGRVSAVAEIARRTLASLASIRDAGIFDMDNCHIDEFMEHTGLTRQECKKMLYHSRGFERAKRAWKTVMLIQTLSQFSTQSFTKVELMDFFYEYVR